MYMNGTIMLRHAFRLPECLVDQNIGEHGTRISSKLFVEPKHRMVIGHMESIFMATLIFTEQP